MEKAHNAVDSLLKQVEISELYTKPDYTGASAQKYIDKYTNRPEDAGSLEGIQKLLGTIGMIPGVGEPADWLNASIYASQGDIGNAALYGSGLGAYGGLKLFRGVPEWFRKSMVKEGKYVGKGHPAAHELWGEGKESLLKGLTTYTSTNPKLAKSYANQVINQASDEIAFLKSKGFGKERIEKLKNIIKEFKGKGKVLEFDIPEKVLKDIGLKSRKVHLKRTPDISGISYAFPKGIPKKYLKKVHKVK